MKSKLRIRINIIISILIMIGFTAVGLTSYNTYSKIIKDDIVNISKLTSTNIYSDISNELTKPIFVALTMANDTFVKTWMAEEASGNQSAEHQLKLQNYLLGIKNKYGYNSVFLVSEATRNYYYFEGLNKTVQPQNSHDQWYFDFIQGKALYSLDVDTDEANHNLLTVFINCKILDQDGNMLGVTGVGVELNQIQSLLKQFENDFDLSAMLFDQNGVVQVSSDSSYLENENVFDINVLNENKEKLLSNKDSLESFQYTDKASDGYLITRYIKDMDWYLLIKKDTSILTRSLYDQLLNDLIIFAIVLFILLFIVNRLIKHNEKILIHMAKTDLLTNLPNRRGFNISLDEIINRDQKEDSLFVFVFDIDNFKHINDQYGHLIGDKIITQMGQLAQNMFSAGSVFRWGGDEFAGFASGEKVEVFNLIENFFRQIRQDALLSSYGVSISLGITRFQTTSSKDTLLYRADQALYQAKEGGKNKYIYFE